MRFLFKLIGLLLFFALMMSACEEKKWPESSISKAPAYIINDMAGSEVMYQLEVIPEGNLVIEYEEENFLNSFEAFDFVDNSTSDVYDFEFLLKKPAVTETGLDTTLLRYYEYEGTKADSSGLYFVYEVDNNGEKNQVGLGSMKIFESELYIQNE